MSQTSFDPDRLQTLVAALCDNNLTNTEERELEQLVCSDTEARAFYIRYLHLHSGLGTYLAGAAEPAKMNERSAAGHIAEGPVAGHLSSQIVHTEESRAAPESRLQRAWEAFYDAASNYVTLSLLISSIVMTIIMLSMALIVPGWNDGNRNGQVDSTTFVAEVTNTHEATWGQESAVYFGSTSLLPGDHVVLKSGLAEITFVDGAVVLLEGPTLFRVASSGAGALDAGKLFAHVPEQGIGFTIDTPRARVVDLGTEFGLEVTASGDTLTEVIEGAVEILRRGDDGTLLAKRRLRAGEAVVAVVGQPGLATWTAKSSFVRTLPQPVDSAKQTTFALPFRLPFDTPADSPAAMATEYPVLSLQLNGGQATVSRGRLELAPALNSGITEQLATIRGLPTPGPNETVLISVDMGAAESNGRYNVGLVVGEQTLRFHPGFQTTPGAFRVDGATIGENSDMGFVPANLVLHHVTVLIHSDGLHEVTIVDGEDAQNIFTTSFIKKQSHGGVFRLQRQGNDEAASPVWFDNLVVTVKQRTDSRNE